MGEVHGDLEGRKVNKMTEDNKLNKILSKIEAVDTKVTNLDTKVTNLDTKVTNLDGRVAKLEDKFDKRAEQVDRRFDKVDNKLNKMDKTLTVTYKQTGHLTEFENVTLSKLNSIQYDLSYLIKKDKKAVKND